jgi:ATP-binding cassette, subfamily B, bacterial
MSDASRMLRSCARDEWRALAVAAVSTVAVVVSYLARPLPLALAVDQILDHGTPFELTAADRRLLVVLAGLVLVIVLLNTLGNHFADDRLENAAERIVHRLRVATYSRLQRLSLAFHERRRTGNLVSHVTGDVNAVGSLFADSLGGVASAGMVLLGMLTVSLLIDPVVAATAFAAAPALALISFRYQPRVRALAKRRRAVTGEIASLSDESLSSIRAVKALGGEGFEEERLERKSEELQHISRESNRLEGRMSILVDSLGGLALALVVVVGVLRGAAGAISVGELIILYTYARRIDRPLRGLARTVGRASRSLARAERVAEVLASDELVEDRPGAFSGARARGEIELRDVEFSYEPDRPAIAEFSLHVPAGQKLALVGRSGAGKSTLAALIARLYDPNEGQVLIDGRDARDCSVSWLREQFGLVLQETILFTGTVAENIAYGVEEATSEAIAAAAKAAGADGFIARLPSGYDTMLGPQAVALSGGQRQRIAIARTLLRDPSVLIVDEPTMGLDAISEAAVLAGLEELMRGRTTIIITHSHRLAATAERVVVVDAGRVARDGRPEEVLADERFDQVRAVTA